MFHHETDMFVSLERRGKHEHKELEEVVYGLASKPGWSCKSL